MGLAHQSGATASAAVRTFGGVPLDAVGDHVETDMITPLAGWRASCANPISDQNDTNATGVPDALQSGIRQGMISSARGVFVGSQSITHPAPPHAMQGERADSTRLQIGMHSR